MYKRFETLENLSHKIQLWSPWTSLAVERGQNFLLFPTFPKFFQSSLIIIIYSNESPVPITHNAFYLLCLVHQRPCGKVWKCNTLLFYTKITSWNLFTRNLRNYWRKEMYPEWAVTWCFGPLFVDCDNHLFRLYRLCPCAHVYTRPCECRSLGNEVRFH